MYQPTSPSKLTYDKVIIRTKQSVKTSRAWGMRTKWKTNSTRKLTDLNRKEEEKSVIALAKSKSWKYCDKLCPNCTSALHRKIYPSTSFPQDRLMACGCSANLTLILLVTVYCIIPVLLVDRNALRLFLFQFEISFMIPSLMKGKTCVCHAILFFTFLIYVDLLFSVR